MGDYDGYKSMWKSRRLKEDNAGMQRIGQKNRVTAIEESNTVAVIAQFLLYPKSHWQLSKF
jgi:hypothetical protein